MNFAAQATVSDNEGGLTALMLAAKKGRTDIARMNMRPKNESRAGEGEHQ